MLVNQPSRMPNRKIMAVIFAGFLVNGAVGTAEMFYPGIKETFPVSDWIDALAMILAGYYVRERASDVPSESA